MHRITLMGLNSSSQATRGKNNKLLNVRRDYGPLLFRVSLVDLGPFLFYCPGLSEHWSRRARSRGLCRRLVLACGGEGVLVPSISGLDQQSRGDGRQADSQEAPQEMLHQEQELSTWGMTVFGEWFCSLHNTRSGGPLLPHSCGDSAQSPPWCKMNS